MARVKTEGILYKLISYTDHSAIATIFSRDYGKLKLFIPRAFSKKGGTYKFLPGLFDIYKKEQSELNKFYNFEPYLKFKIFIENPYILIRLNIIFTLFDEFGLEEEENGYFWRLITSINEENIYKSSVFITSYLLKKSGFSPEFVCCNCKGTGNLYLSFDNNVYCKNCIADGEKSFFISEKVVTIFHFTNNIKKFKTMKIYKEEEIEFLLFIRKYTERLTGVSMRVFDMLTVL